MELIHTCYRITDIDRSVAFYTALGFEDRRRMPIREEAINVFMGLPGAGDQLELTYNFGVDSYELGTGYGHIALTVDDMNGTLEQLAGQGIEPERPPYQLREGGSFLCFVRDPDGYRIELIERGSGSERERLDHDHGDLAFRAGRVLVVVRPDLGDLPPQALALVAGRRACPPTEVVALHLQLDLGLLREVAVPTRMLGCASGTR